MTTAGTNDQPQSVERVAFYFSAHQDDWQLFMNPPAFRDVLDDKARCVFIHMTAGDAGLGIGTGGRKHPLYLAREHGAESAIRFMADANERIPVEPACTTVTRAGHSIRCVSYRNTAAYFLRLPDGNPEGTGYKATGFQSLKRLASGEIKTISAIDGSATYQGWDDLVSVIRHVIDAERGQSSFIDIHVPEMDPALNPNDHADHILTAKAAREAAEGLRARLMHHDGYASASMPENLTPEERDMKGAVYAVTLAGVLAFGHPVSWQHYDQLFVGRSYCRVEPRR